MIKIKKVMKKTTYTLKGLKYHDMELLHLALDLIDPKMVGKAGYMEGCTKDGIQDSLDGLFYVIDKVFD